MICPKCRKQIPDNSDHCPFCAGPIDHRAQLPREISARRYQRWFFYGLISLMFVGMIATIAKIYSVNTALVEQMVSADQALRERKSELEEAKSQIATTTVKLTDLEKTLEAVNKEIAAKTDSYKELLFEKNSIEEKYGNEQAAKEGAVKSKTECESKLTQTDAMVYSMIVSLGMGVTNNNLKKIPMADANLKGEDSDADGLPDLVEIALGTDKDKRDTDGDGFEDKREVLGHFNAGGEGSLPTDENFTNAMKGRILLQVERNGEAWYVNPSDSKKYFLGRPGDALSVLASLKK
jgi:hypothetical protein